MTQFNLDSAQLTSTRIDFLPKGMSGIRCGTIATTVLPYQVGHEKCQGTTLGLVVIYWTSFENGSAKQMHIYEYTTMDFSSIHGKLRVY